MNSFLKIFSLLRKRKKTAYEACNSTFNASVKEPATPLIEQPECLDILIRTRKDQDFVALSDMNSLSDYGVYSDGAASSRATMEITDETLSCEGAPPLILAIKTGDVAKIREILEDSPELVNNPRYYGFAPIHYACFAKDVNVLKELLKHGANVHALTSRCRTALHEVVQLGWYDGIIELLKIGASPDAIFEPPKTVQDLHLETPLHTAIRKGDLTATTLLLQYHSNLKVKDSDDNSILHLAAKARSLEIVQLFQKEKVCRDLINDKNDRGENVLHSLLQKDCCPENESIIKEVLNIFIEMNADFDAINLKGESPLYLAAQSRLSSVVELLISVGATVTQVTKKGQTLIHAACQSGSGTVLSQLLDVNIPRAFITQGDKDGREPFHYAVRSSSIDCCELLLKNGDHLTREDKDGISRLSLILQYLPSAIPLLERLFDTHIQVSNKPETDPDFKLDFDYSVLLSLDDGEKQTSLISELINSNLEPLLKHPLLESFLFFKWQKIKTFFYISVLIYFLYLILHTIFIVLTFGKYELNWSKQQQILWIFIILHIVMYVLILIPDIFFLLANFKKYLRQLETYSKLLALCSSAFILVSCTVPVKIYTDAGFQGIQKKENLRNEKQIIFPDSVRRAIPIIFPGDENHLPRIGGHDINEANRIRISRETEIPFANITYNATHINKNVTDNVKDIDLVRYAAAISSFLGWIEFMMLLGRFPALGSYVLMFTHVAKSVIRFMFAFSSLLIGFTLCFMVLFHNSVFDGFLVSLVKTLMMMIGEIEYGDLYSSLETYRISLVALVLFIFLVCIVMANLLIGLAVNDIPELLRRGKIKRLAKQAAYLVASEKLISIADKWKCFPSSLHNLMVNRCKINKKVSVYPSRDSRNGRYKNCLLQEDSIYPGRDFKKRKYKNYLPSETVKAAILLGSSEEAKVDMANMDIEDVGTLLTSFKKKYNRDRKILTKRLEELPDNSVTEKLLTQRFDQMQKTMESHLIQLSLQIQQQLQQNLNQNTQNYPRVSTTSTLSEFPSD